MLLSTVPLSPVCSRVSSSRGSTSTSTPRLEPDCCYRLAACCLSTGLHKQRPGWGWWPLCSAAAGPVPPAGEARLQAALLLRERTCRQQQQHHKAQTLRTVRLVPQHSANPLKRGTSCTLGAAAITLLSVLLLLAAPACCCCCQTRVDMLNMLLTKQKVTLFTKPDGTAVFKQAAASDAK